MQNASVVVVVISVAEDVVPLVAIDSMGHARAVGRVPALVQRTRVGYVFGSGRRPDQNHRCEAAPYPTGEHRI